MSEHVLRARGLTRRFGGVVAVRDVDLDIATGERRAVLGPNGAGKSSLFNLLAGADTPTAGSIELFGRDVTVLGARQRTRMGLSRTFQTSRLLGGLTVEDNLYLAAVGVDGGRFRLIRNRRDARARERAAEVAESVGMTHRLGELAGELSHGEQRQLLTALLLGLDREVTLLIIEHDMDVALTVAERVTMMYEGAVIVEGTPAEIRSNQRVHDLYLGRAHV